MLGPLRVGDPGRDKGPEAPVCRTLRARGLAGRAGPPTSGPARPWRHSPSVRRWAAHSTGRPEWRCPFRTSPTGGAAPPKILLTEAEIRRYRFHHEHSIRKRPPFPLLTPHTPGAADDPIRRSWPRGPLAGNASPMRPRMRSGPLYREQTGRADETLPYTSAPETPIPQDVGGAVGAAGSFGLALILCPAAKDPQEPNPSSAGTRVRMGGRSTTCAPRGRTPCSTGLPGILKRGAVRLRST